VEGGLTISAKEEMTILVDNLYSCIFSLLVMVKRNVLLRRSVRLRGGGTRDQQLQFCW